MHVLRYAANVVG